MRCSTSQMLRYLGWHCEMPVIPSNRIVFSISSFMTKAQVSYVILCGRAIHLLSMECSTPSCPYTSEYKNGLPIPTALAPRHKALMMSVPRRTPQSM